MIAMLCLPKVPFARRAPWHAAANLRRVAICPLTEA
jgi:hypothetical protein